MVAQQHSARDIVIAERSCLHQSQRQLRHSEIHARCIGIHDSQIVRLRSHETGRHFLSP